MASVNEYPSAKAHETNVEKVVQLEAGQTEGIPPGFRALEVRQEPAAARRMHEHGLHSMRSGSQNIGLDTELTQNVNSAGTDVLGARLVARKIGLVEKQNAVTKPSQLGRDRASARTAANHDGFVVRHRCRCSRPRPFGTIAEW